MNFENSWVKQFLILLKYDRVYDVLIKVENKNIVLITTLCI